MIWSIFDFNKILGSVIIHVQAKNMNLLYERLWQKSAFYINSLVQECSFSIALAVEKLQPCIMPPITWMYLVLCPHNK